MTTTVRGVLMAAGLALIGYGAVLLADNLRQILIRIAVWAAAGVLLHDAVFAPACVALGFASRRVVPQSVWSPLPVAGLCTVVIALLAIPVYDKPGLQPDNPSALDRDYHAGLWISLAVVWGSAALVRIVNRLRPADRNVVSRR